MSPWWLLLIVPVCMGAGVLCGALIAVAGMESRKKETEAAARKEVQPVKIRARREIPRDVWLDRISRMDAKIAAAWLQRSMAEQLAAEAAPHVAVRCEYHPETQSYRVWAAALVVPMEGKK